MLSFLKNFGKSESNDTSPNDGDNKRVNYNCIGSRFSDEPEDVISCIAPKAQSNFNSNDIIYQIAERYFVPDGPNADEIQRLSDALAFVQANFPQEYWTEDFVIHYYNSDVGFSEEQLGLQSQHSIASCYTEANAGNPELPMYAEQLQNFSRIPLSPPTAHDSLAQSQRGQPDLYRTDPSTENNSHLITLNFAQVDEMYSKLRSSKQLGLQVIKSYEGVSIKDCRDRNNVSVLHVACELDGVEVVQYLCKLGASPFATDRWGRLPLHCASANGFVDNASYLISLGCSPLVTTSEGYTSAHHAARGNHVQLLSYLVNLEPSLVTLATKSGVTPLLLAAKHGCTSCVRFLVDQAGADVRARESSAVDCLSMAAWNGHFEICNYLLHLAPHRRPNLDNRSDYGYTCLHYACLSGSVDLIRLLLDNSVDRTALDANGMRAADLTQDHQIKHLIANYYAGMKSSSGHDVAMSTVTNISTGFNQMYQQQSNSFPLGDPAHVSAYPPNPPAAMQSTNGAQPERWNAVAEKQSYLASDYFSKLPVHEVRPNVEQQASHLTERTSVSIVLNTENTPGNTRESTSTSLEKNHIPSFSLGTDHMSTVPPPAADVPEESRASVVKATEMTDLKVAHVVDIPDTERTPAPAQLTPTSAAQPASNYAVELSSDLESVTIAPAIQQDTTLREDREAVGQPFASPQNAGPITTSTSALPSIAPVTLSKTTFRGGHTTISFESSVDSWEPAAKESSSTTLPKADKESAHTALSRGGPHEDKSPVRKIYPLNKSFVTDIARSYVSGQTQSFASLSGSGNEVSLKAPSMRKPKVLGGGSVTTKLRDDGMPDEITDGQLDAFKSTVSSVAQVSNSGAPQQVELSQHAQVTSPVEPPRPQIEASLELDLPKPAAPLEKPALLSNPGLERPISIAVAEKRHASVESFTQQIFNAASHGALVDLKALLTSETDRPPDLDLRSLRDERSRTPLHRACELRQVGSMTLLVELAGLDVDAQDGDGCTSLHYLSKLGDLSAVKYLFKRGANPNITDSSGATALHLASSNGHYEICQYLISEANCNPLARDAEGFSPVHLAARGDHVRVLKLLVGASPFAVFAVSGTGMTPLLLACSQGSVESVTYLVDKAGADAQARDPNGVDCLSMACWNGHLSVSRYLLTLDPQRRPSLDNCSSYGYTCLHYACISGNYDLVRDLLDRGALPSAKDLNGMTPSALAKDGRIQDLIADHVRTAELAAAASPPSRSIASLPLGWVEFKDQNSGLPYYYHAASGVTQWDLPSDDDEVQREHIPDLPVNSMLPLLPGWVELQDPASGMTYYYNDVDKSSQWDRPVATGHDSPPRRSYTSAASPGRLSTRSLSEQSHINTPTVDTLLSDSANPSALASKVFACARGGDMRGLYSLLGTAPAIKADVNAMRDSELCTPLHLACKHGQIRVIQFLVEGVGANVDAVDARGWTSLHYACDGNHALVVRYLVKLCGVDITIKDVQGRLASSLALQPVDVSEDDDIVRIINKAQKKSPTERRRVKVPTYSG